MTELEPVSEIVLDRMIFHIVGRHLNEPDILTEVDDIEPHRSFFTERLEATMRGAKYVFRTGSSFRDLIAEAVSNKDKFVEVSETLARRFQEYYVDDKRLSPGVIMLFSFEHAGKNLCALVKFDDKSVVSYKTKEDGDKKRPVLENIKNTFVQEKSAMHKSAVVYIQDEGGTLICVDRSGKRGDLTDKFRQYIDARRELSDAELTKRLYEAVLETGKKCAEHIPPESAGELKKRARDALATGSGYDPENPNEFLLSVFGQLPDDSPLFSQFKNSLKSRNILDEPIEFDESDLPPASKKIRETFHGVRVIYSDEDVGREISFPDHGDGKKRILIETTRFMQNDILDE